MEAVLDWLSSIPVWVAYAVALASPALEASTFIGVLIPGETAMIAAGALAGIGEASVWWVALAGATGAILGDSVGYLVGKRWGERAMRGKLGKIIGRDRWRHAKRHFEKGGFGSIVLARFAPALRSVAPGAAGAAKMPYRRFLFANALGGIIWAAGSVALGWGMARSLTMLDHAHWIVTGAGVAIAVGAGIWIWRKLGRGGKRQRPSSSSSAAA